MSAAQPEPRGLRRPVPPWLSRLLLRPYRSGALVVLVLCTLALFWRMFALGEAFYPTDAVNEYFPWRWVAQRYHLGLVHPQSPQVRDALFLFFPRDQFYHESLVHGHIPLWNPYSYCGHPLLAEGLDAVLFPPRLLAYTLLDPVHAQNLLLFCYVLIAGLGMYWYLYTLGLSRTPRLVGSLAWMLNGFVMAWLELQFIGAFAALLPCLMASLERLIQAPSPPRAARLALFGGLTLLAGHVQFVLYASLLAALYLLARRPGRRTLAWALLAGVLAASLGTPQFLPTLELSHFAQRPSYTAAEMLAENRFLPEHLLTFFIPDVFGGAGSGFYLGRIHSAVQNGLELTPYIGATAMLLVVLALARPWHRVTAFYASLTVVLLLLAAGTPVYYGIAAVAPIFRQLTPTRVVYLVCFALSVLAALGAQAWLEGRGRRLLAVAAGVLAIPTALLIAWIALLQSNGAIALHVLDSCRQNGSLYAHILSYTPHVAATADVDARVRDHYSWRNPVLYLPLLAAWAALALMVWRSEDPVRQRLSRLGVLACLAIELVAHGQTVNPTGPVSAVYPPTPTTTLLQRIPQPGRVAGLVTVMPPASLMAYHIQDMSGYSSLYPGGILDMVTWADGRPPAQYTLPFLSAADSPHLQVALDLLNVEFVLTDPMTPLPLPRDWSRRLQWHRDMNIYVNPDALPRAFLVPAWVVDPDTRQELIAVFAGGFKPKELAVVDRQPQFPTPSGPPAPPAVVWQRYEPERMQLAVQCPTNQLLVISDAWYPGWKAEVDGRPTPVLRADVMIRAIPLGPGPHQVVLRYQPATLQYGLYAASVASLVLLGLLLAGLRAAHR